MKKRYRCKPARSGGFTLIEVLISVVIFSVGLLGLAGLQATGIKLNHSSLLRTQATLMAYDIADCMRANRGNVSAYEIDWGADSGTGGQAERDVDDWMDNLDGFLPIGEGFIHVDSGRATVRVRWDDNRDGVHDQTLTLETDI